MKYQFQVKNPNIPFNLISLQLPQISLLETFNQLNKIKKQYIGEHRTQQINEQTVHQEIKGLKFIAYKLGRLFHKHKKFQYSEVSKLLIKNFAQKQRDQRNIKRRVYDAVNVLLAADVLLKRGNFIQKTIYKESSFWNRNEKKKCKSNETEQKELQQKETKLQQKIAHKREQLQEIRQRIFKIKKIFQRNQIKQDQNNLENMNIIENPIIIQFNNKYPLTFKQDSQQNKLTYTLQCQGLNKYENNTKLENFKYLKYW